MELQEQAAGRGELGREEAAHGAVDAEAAGVGDLVEGPTTGLDHQLGATAEVVVDGARGHAGPAGDLADGGALVAPLDARRRRRRQQPVARARTLDRGEPGAAATGRHRLSHRHASLPPSGCGGRRRPAVAG